MSSKAEVLIFRRGHVPSQIAKYHPRTAQHILLAKRVLRYAVKGGQRRLLDNVNGWVKPGTLTALMGISEAGRTTLLDVLAKRVFIGVVAGDMFVDGRPLDTSFQRKTGYVQQYDLHLPTTTVREALRFSAALRQPKTVSKAEK
ncbi:hypothetical protein BDW66DRAFT_151125 [Aspergillus desertorum]